MAQFLNLRSCLRSPPCRTSQPGRCVHSKRIGRAELIVGAAPASAVTSSQSEHFSERFSGQWEGQEAVFSGSGKPEPLPEDVVPAAMQEWGIVPLDWQTRCQSTANEAGGVKYEFQRLAPVTGCEADYVAESQSWQQDVLTSTADGSYLAHKLENGSHKADMCFALSEDRRLRIRLLASTSNLDTIQLHLEHKYDSADSSFPPLQAQGTVLPFAEKDALDPALLSSFEPEEGYWQSAAGQDGSRPPDLRNRSKAVCLPLQAFAYAAQHGSSLVMQAGVVKGDGANRSRVSGSLIVNSSAEDQSSSLQLFGFGHEGHC